MRTTAAGVLALATTASAIKGFNYGSTFTTGAAKTQKDFEDEFTTAANLEGTSDFTSARLYTMVVSIASFTSWAPSCQNNSGLTGLTV